MAGSFTIELMVSEKCNLGCPYCYVSNKNKLMTPETFDKIYDEILFYMNKMHCDTYNISYFGGEPLENFETVKYIHEKVKNDPKCEHDVLISNMSLITEEIVDYILKENIPVSFSFDGLASNESRPLLPVKENKGFKKSLDLYESKWHLITKVCNGCHSVMSPSNIHLLSKNVDFLLSKGINSIDYALAKDDIWTNDDVKKFKYYYHEYIDNCIDKIKHGIYVNGGFHYVMLADSVQGLLDKKRHTSCFAGSNGCGISADGEFYACARFATKGIFKYTHDMNFDEIFNDLDTHNYEKCKKCDLFYFCNQGCVYSQLRNGNEPIESACDIYKIIFNEMNRMIEELKDNKLFQSIVNSHASYFRSNNR